MRTTLDLPDGLVEAARDTIGFKSKTDTVVYALKEVVRRGRVDDLKAMFGKVHVSLDLDATRERPRRATR
ncbi:MAG: type II toxin-antitoxin system VapB family antitoxin [Acidobacteria bacterium]|nr:type II toxin-antitoxin system VapB family antitoxin [Acidobacteriota bacterium]